MTDNLHNDMCHLRRPGARSSDVCETVLARCIPAHLRYACQYWVLHLQKSHDSYEQNLSAYVFLRKYFLNWLETLSLLKQLDDAIAMLGSLDMMFVSRFTIP
jgi:hypothetical protein